MQSLEDILRHHAQLEAERSNFNLMWQEVADRVLPDHGWFQNQQVTQGEKRTQKQYDSTAMIAAERHASAIDSLMTPRASKWHRITASITDLNDDDEVREESRWPQQQRQPEADDPGQAQCPLGGADRVEHLADVDGQALAVEQPATVPKIEHQGGKHGPALLLFGDLAAACPVPLQPLVELLPHPGVELHQTLFWRAFAEHPGADVALLLIAVRDGGAVRCGLCRAGRSRPHPGGCQSGTSSG
jgi:hypothetical protein